MFPSSGYFKNIKCPYFSNGNCDRPYCHYSHDALEGPPMQCHENAEPNFINFMANTIKHVKNSFQSKDLHNQVSQFTNHPYESHETYQPNLPKQYSIPEYKPTPIDELNLKSNRNIKTLDGNVIEDDELVDFTLNYLSKLPKDQLSKLKAQFKEKSMDPKNNGIDFFVVQTKNKHLSEDESPLSPDISDPNSGVKITKSVYNNLQNSESVNVTTNLNKENEKNCDTDILLSTKVKGFKVIDRQESNLENKSINKTTDIVQMTNLNLDSLKSVLQKAKFGSSKLVTNNVKKTQKISTPFKSLDIDIFANSGKSKAPILPLAPKAVRKKYLLNNIHKGLQIKNTVTLQAKSPEISNPDDEDDNVSMVSVPENETDLFGSDQEMAEVTYSSPSKLAKKDLTKDRLTQLKDEIFAASNEKNCSFETMSLQESESEARRLLLRMEGGGGPARSENSSLRQENSSINAAALSLKGVKRRAHDSTDFEASSADNLRKSRLKSAKIALRSNFADTCAPAIHNPALTMLKRITSVAPKETTHKTKFNPSGNNDPQIIEYLIQKGAKTRVAHTPNTENTAPLALTSSSNPKSSTNTNSRPSLDSKTFALSQPLNITDSDRYLKTGEDSLSSSKISLTIRQKYLNLIWTEVLVALTKLMTSFFADKRYSSLKTADWMNDPNFLDPIKRIAFVAEHTAFAKCKAGNKNIYFNLAAAAVKSIRTEKYDENILAVIQAKLQSTSASANGLVNPDLLLNSTQTARRDARMTLFQTTFANLLKDYLLTRPNLVANGYPYLLNILKHHQLTLDFREKGPLIEKPTFSKIEQNTTVVCIEPVNKQSIDTFVHQNQPLLSTAGYVALLSQQLRPALPKPVAKVKISIHKDPSSASLLGSGRSTSPIKLNLSAQSSGNKEFDYEQSDGLLTHRFNCCRCAKEYEVLEQRVPGCPSIFTYVKPDDECLYHWGKLRKTGGFSNKKNAGPALLKYSCCGGAGQERGCTLAPLHVTDKSIVLYYKTESLIDKLSAVPKNNTKYLETLPTDHPLKCWRTTCAQLVSRHLPFAGSASDLLKSEPDENSDKMTQHDENLSGNDKYSQFFPFDHTFDKAAKIDGGGQLAVYGLDCEMVYTPLGNEVARVTLVGINTPANRDLARTYSTSSNSHNNDKEHEFVTVYDVFVQPRNLPLVDCNTRFSGITAGNLDPEVTPSERTRPLKTFTEAQSDVLKILVRKGITTKNKSLNKTLAFNTILIGHSLESDLVGLQIVHEIVVDTALVFPHRMGLPFKRALRTLSGEFLKKIIQDDVSGHDSAEDAQTCLELMKWKILQISPKAFAV